MTRISTRKHEMQPKLSNHVLMAPEVQQTWSHVCNIDIETDRLIERTPLTEPRDRWGLMIYRNTEKGEIAQNKPTKWTREKKEKQSK